MSAPHLPGIVVAASKDRADETALVRVPSATNPKEAAIVVISPPEKSPPLRHEWVTGEEMLRRRSTRAVEHKHVLRDTITDVAMGLGMVDAVRHYTGLDVRRRPGRPVGSPSRQKRHVMDDAERMKIARAVHAALGNPERGAKLSRGLKKKVVGDMAVVFSLKDKTVYDVYRDLRAMVQKEIVDAEWYRQFEE